ncbi:MAG: hypothetical protein C0478_04540 [Planctomyces sp.]|jgi:hypothetical protein|nr:hypothetical protein [Planctomyces sp.]
MGTFTREWLMDGIRPAEMDDSANDERFARSLSEALPAIIKPVLVDAHQWMLRSKVKSSRKT